MSLRPVPAEEAVPVNMVRLRWLVGSSAVAGVLLVEAFRHNVLDHLYAPFVSGAISNTLLIIGASGFTYVVLTWIARMHDQVMQGRRQAEALYEIGRSLSSLRTAPWSLEAPLARMREMLGADVAIFGALDPVQREITCQSFSGVRDPVHAAGIRLHLGQEVLGRVVSSGHWLKTEAFPKDFTDLPDSYPLLQTEGLVACLAVPVGARGEVTGALLVGYRHARRIPDGELQFLENVAAQMGIALENTRLYRKSEQVAMLEERDRLAREMHDGLAQALAALHLRLEAVTLAARSKPDADLGPELERMQAACAAAYADVRQAILNLRQRLPAGTDLAGYLAEYLHQFGREHDLEVEAAFSAGGVPALAPTSEAQMIRILQEILNNVVRHSRARHVRVQMEARDGQLALTVRDDGLGFDPAAVPTRGHLGLAIMRERAEQAGGSVAVQSAPGTGTQVRVLLPMAEPEWSQSRRERNGNHPDHARR